MPYDGFTHDAEQQHKYDGDEDDKWYVNLLVHCILLQSYYSAYTQAGRHV